MPAQYEVRRNRSGNYDVFWRQLFTNKELSAKLKDLVKNGWDADDSEIEIRAMADTFAKCTDDPAGSSLEACQEFIASYTKPGDVVMVLNQVFMVNRAVQEEPRKVWFEAVAIPRRVRKREVM